MKILSCSACQRRRERMAKALATAKQRAKELYAKLKQ